MLSLCVRSHRTLGAHSCMIATAAEANPTCFSPKPYTDLETTLIPSYIRLVRISLVPAVAPSPRTSFIVQISGQPLVLDKILLDPIQRPPRRRNKAEPNHDQRRHHESEKL